MNDSHFITYNGSYNCKLIFSSTICVLTSSDYRKQQRQYLHLLVMLSTAVLLVILVFSYTVVCENTIKLDHECKPRPVLFDLNKYASGPPNFTELYRCMGHDNSDRMNYRCVNTTAGTTSLTFEGTIYYNHTTCNQELNDSLRDLWVC